MTLENRVVIISGANGATGKLATVTFSASYGAAPNVTLTPAGANATGLTYYVDSSTTSTTAFDIDTNTAPASTTTYKYYYHTIQ